MAETENSDLWQCYWHSVHLLFFVLFFDRGGGSRERERERILMETVPVYTQYCILNICLLLLARLARPSSIFITACSGLRWRLEGVQTDERNTDRSLTNVTPLRLGYYYDYAAISTFFLIPHLSHVRVILPLSQKPFVSNKIQEAPNEFHFKMILKLKCA